MKLIVLMSLTVCATIRFTHSAFVDPCPQYWHFYQGSCYRYYGDRVTFNEALQTCRGVHSSNGQGDLVSIHSQQENSFLYNLYRSSAGVIPPGTVPGTWGEGAWIGLYQPNHGATDPFVWTDGTTVDYDDAWASGQPDNHRGGEDCAHFWRRGDGDDVIQPWNDTGCNARFAFICKVASNTIEQCPESQ